MDVQNGWPIRFVHVFWGKIGLKGFYFRKYLPTLLFKWLTHFYVFVFSYVKKNRLLKLHFHLYHFLGTRALAGRSFDPSTKFPMFLTLQNLLGFSLVEGRVKKTLHCCFHPGNNTRFSLKCLCRWLSDLSGHLLATVSSVQVAELHGKGKACTIKSFH